METVMMTSTLSIQEFAALGAPNLVYVRPIRAADLIASTPVEVMQGIILDPAQTLYAVHGADGACLAILSDRDSAMAAAVANELAPVSVH